jgi:hypothetical protein
MMVRPNCFIDYSISVLSKFFFIIFLIDCFFVFMFLFVHFNWTYIIELLLFLCKNIQCLVINFFIGRCWLIHQVRGWIWSQEAYGFHLRINWEMDEFIKSFLLLGNMYDGGAWYIFVSRRNLLWRLLVFRLFIRWRLLVVFFNLKNMLWRLLVFFEIRKKYS